VRIAIVSTPFIKLPPEGYGGTELFCYEIGEELTRRGHEVTLFTTGDSTTSCRRRALYQRAEWPPCPADEVNHAAWSMHAVESERFDVVHLNSPLAIPLTRLSKTPAVYTIHHCRDESFSRVFTAHPEVIYVAISARQLELETPVPHSAVVHHGLSADRYPASEADLGYLLHLGRFAREKGTHVAIGAARRAGVKLVLAGRAHPTDVAYYAEEIEPKLGDGVEAVGEADHEMKLELMRGAKALLLPIDWEEPFGLVVAEAMLCGTPTIAFARGSMPELIEDGVTGFLIPPGDEDALVRAIGAVSAIDRRTCAARARELFTVTTMTDRYEAVYRRAIHRARARVAA
jgi:glycosyltransferase involved in cell wall biosynthesis